MQETSIIIIIIITLAEPVVGYVGNLTIGDKEPCGGQRRVDPTPRRLPAG